MKVKTEDVSLSCRFLQTSLNMYLLCQHIYKGFPMSHHLLPVSSSACQCLHSTLNKLTCEY